MSEVSKVMFVAFTQHCIQSNVTHVTGVKVGVFRCIQSNVTHVRGIMFKMHHSMNKRSKGMLKVSKETQNTL